MLRFDGEAPEQRHEATATSVLQTRACEDEREREKEKGRVREGEGGHGASLGLSPREGGKQELSRRAPAMQQLGGLRKKTTRKTSQIGPREVFRNYKEALGKKNY